MNAIRKKLTSITTELHVLQAMMEEQKLSTRWTIGEILELLAYVRGHLDGIEPSVE